MKIRLHGTAEECEQMAGLLTHLEPAISVVSVSEPCRDRGRSRLCRVYVEVRLPPAADNSPHIPQPGGLSPMPMQPGRAFVREEPTRP